MRMYSLTKSCSILLCALFLTACNHVDEITPRSYVGLAVGHSARLKLEIGKSLLANPGKPVPQAGALQLPPHPGLNSVKFEFGWVSAGGAIFIQSKEYSVTVLQEPRIDQGQVKWSCIVHPVDAKPNVCGDQ